MNDLKDRLIKLGSDNPELRKHIRPVLDRLSADRVNLPNGLQRAFSAVAKECGRSGVGDKQVHPGRGLKKFTVFIPDLKKEYGDGSVPVDEVERKLENLEPDYRYEVIDRDGYMEIAVK
jgi:hypothetical protein